jgi:CxxC-x17-CxxC domain-containing protein
MGNFNRNDRGGRRSFDRGGFGGNRFDRGGTRGGARQMFKAICSNCGKSCEVPFQPTSSKPVYCSDCFEKMGNGGRDGRRDDRRSDRPRFDDRRPQGAGNDQNKALLENINTKLEKIIRLLEPKAVLPTTKETSEDPSQVNDDKPARPKKVIATKVVKATKKVSAAE